jgi:hypothetical protein
MEHPRRLLCGAPPGVTRDISPRQLPTDHDYAVSTREYQSDQPSSPASATTDTAFVERSMERRHSEFRPNEPT